MATANLARVVFALSNRELPGDVTLTPTAWRVLTQCDGTRTVADIARALGMDESAVGQVAEVLFRCGALQVAPGSVSPPRLTLPKTFVDQLANELARAMGPLAVLTLEDEMAAMGETRESFPRDGAAELVERLSHVIRDETRRVRFLQVMLDAIRKL